MVRCGLLPFTLRQIKLIQGLVLDLSGTFEFGSCSLKLQVPKGACARERGHRCGQTNKNAKNISKKVAFPGNHSNPKMPRRELKWMTAEFCPGIKSSFEIINVRVCVHIFNKNIQALVEGAETAD